MNCFNKSKIYIFLNCPSDIQLYEGRACEGLRVWQMNEETALIWSMALIDLLAPKGLSSLLALLFLFLFLETRSK